MTWVKISDTLPEHPKFDVPGYAGLGLHIAAVAYCNRQLTDGRIARQRARTLLPDETVDTADLIDKLLAAGLWEVRDGDDANLWIVGYTDDQFSSEQVIAKRKTDAARQKSARERRERSEARTVSHAVTNGVTASVSHGVSPSAPTRPDPTPREGRAVRAGGRRSGAYAPAADPQQQRQTSPPTDRAAGRIDDSDIFDLEAELHDFPVVFES